MFTGAKGYCYMAESASVQDEAILCDNRLPEKASQEGSILPAWEFPSCS